MSEGHTAYDRDEYGNVIDPAEACQQFMLLMYDMTDEAGLAGFSPELIAQLHEVRVRFVEEFEARFPGYGKGRAVWR